MKWPPLPRRACSFALAGFTIVSVPQEIEIGKQENAQVRKQTAELRDAQVTAYIARIGERLAKAAPGAKYPYSFQVANYREINAFSLPGGPVWINRGVLHAAADPASDARRRIVAAGMRVGGEGQRENL